MSMIVMFSGIGTLKEDIKVEDLENYLEDNEISFEINGLDLIIRPDTAKFNFLDNFFKELSFYLSAGKFMCMTEANEITEKIFKVKILDGNVCVMSYKKDLAFTLSHYFIKKI
jgi:hypothetical protein